MILHMTGSLDFDLGIMFVRDTVVERDSERS